MRSPLPSAKVCQLCTSRKTRPGRIRKRCEHSTQQLFGVAQRLFAFAIQWGTPPLLAHAQSSGLLKTLSRNRVGTSDSIGMDIRTAVLASSIRLQLSRAVPIKFTDRLWEWGNASVILRWISYW